MGARTLHIANGSCTTALIERAGIAGDRSIWADPLHDGPVPEGLSADALRELRARYLFPDEDWRGAFDEVSRWDLSVQRMADHDEVILWFEHDLFDQLNLIQLLSRIAEIRTSDSPPVSLVCINAYPGRLNFKGLGELTPEEIGGLLQIRTSVTQDQFALAERAWRAFRSPDPRTIEILLTGDTAALPFLAGALRRHLEEFPDATDGLSLTERRVLKMGSTPVALRTAFSHAHEDETAFFIADLSFWNVVRSLGRTDPPLLNLSVVPDDVALAMHEAVLETTNVGRFIVDQAADRIPITGIDSWRGGVHLIGRQSVWRWDPRKERITRS